MPPVLLLMEHSVDIAIVGTIHLKSATASRSKTFGPGAYNWPVHFDNPKLSKGDNLLGT